MTASFSEAIREAVIEQQEAEIQRLRAALMAIGAWKHTDQPEHPLQRMAREALREDRT